MFASVPEYTALFSLRQKKDKFSLLLQQYYRQNKIFTWVIRLKNLKIVFLLVRHQNIMSSDGHFFIKSKSLLFCLFVCIYFFFRFPLTVVNNLCLVVIYIQYFKIFVLFLLEPSVVCFINFLFLWKERNSVLSRLYVEILL